MTQNEEYTLSKLLSEFTVEIPAIQRDYAFGRKGYKESQKRIKFIEALANAIQFDNKIHLDFIYGKKESDVFIPLDGQQRLTTLWLLSVYMEKLNFFPIDYLKRFTYNTRTSTREFCSSLLVEEYRLTGNLEEDFFKKRWFFNSWKNDSSIIGMCVVLEEIHKQLHSPLKNINLNNITFSFLDIQELGQPEDLYIKMNSRGKELSDWDNFKARLFEKITNPEFQTWIDTLFLDFFWNLGEDGEDRSKNTEPRMLRLFYLVIFSKEITKESNNFENTNEFVEDIIKNWKNKQYITNGLDMEIRKFIKFITKNKSRIEQEEFTRFNKPGLRISELMDTLKKTNLNDFFAGIDVFLAYFIVSQKDFEDDKQMISELQQSVRIVSNFEEPYRKTWDIMKQFIPSISQALFNNDGIIEYMSNLEGTSSFGSYSEEQKQEEIAKIKLINRSSEWEQLIYEAEAHPYFTGMIGWLLRASGENINLFRKLSSGLLSKFNEKGLIDRKEISNIIKYKDIRIKNNLFPRNIGDRGANILRDRSWKKVLRGFGYGTNVKNEDVLWIVHWNSKDYFDFDNLDREWKKWFIQYPELFDTFGGIKWKQEQEWYKDYFSNLFLNEWRVTAFSGIKYDLRLYVASMQNNLIKYLPFKSEGETVFAEYKNYKIYFDHVKRNYIIKDRDRTEIKSDASDVKSAINNLNNVLDTLGVVNE